MHAELRNQGWVVNHKRVLRLMRADNLLCLRRRKFVLTTDSKHGLPIYPNLAKDLVLTGIDQLWVADITYIRLQKEFVFLAVLLDAFSRRCVGWALERSLETTLVLGALRMALNQRRPRTSLVHHSDQGVQYASGDYTKDLERHGISISMSRRGNVYDNALAESFIKTLKYEEVYRTEYRDLGACRFTDPSIGSIFAKHRSLLDVTAQCLQGAMRVWILDGSLDLPAAAADVAKPALRLCPTACDPG